MARQLLYSQLLLGALPLQLQQLVLSAVRLQQQQQQEKQEWTAPDAAPVSSNKSNTTIATTTKLQATSENP